ncbi:hypothetical protein [Paenibacillus sp. RC67]|uniref:hypothetical protein n=1 Tax=Paenibacillus sp. RC67 TaxID=3039392 RepID=UPI0024AD65B4|nr:hypothetical protein [Paenibacillus sp. RC67]
MKEAIITDLDGYIKDVTLVAADVTGVFPIYRQLNPLYNPTEEPSELKELEITGYTVAIPVPEGLYKPRFNFTAWELYNQLLEPVIGEAGELESAEEGNVHQSRPAQALWIEGLTPEELKEIQNQKQPESDAEKIARLEAEKEDLKSRLGDVEIIMAEILTGGGK